MPDMRMDDNEGDVTVLVITDVLKPSMVAMALFRGMRNAVFGRYAQGHFLRDVAVLQHRINLAHRYPPQRFE